jgi:hypothetical protein
MLIYSSFDSPRLQYTFQLIFSDILQVDFAITQDITQYNSYNGVKWAYSNEANLNGLVFKTHSLLSENSIKPQDLSPVKWKNYNLFFPVADNENLPFDPFAVAFYLLSRYEEYVFVENRDEHDRFQLQHSIAYQRGFYREPLVNILAVEIAQKIAHFFPEFKWELHPFTTLYTCDVDIAYKYKGKGLLRNFISIVKLLLEREFKEVKKNIYAILGKQIADPFEIESADLELLSQKYNSLIHFLPVSKYGKYDKNLNPNSLSFRKLIDKLKVFSQIGLHPSYFSYKNPKLLLNEKNRLESILNEKVTLSRQHYLRLSLPETYRILLSAGIKDDYSLGWSSDVGFRASVSVPFYFYDLSKETKTDLKIHSLHVMDVALYRVTQSKNEYKAIIEQMHNTVKQWGGEFVILEHNSSQFTFS